MGGVGNNAMPPSTIWVASSKGGGAKQITSPGSPPGGHGAPSWSPDGKRIVFDASDFLSQSLWSVSVEERDLKKIAEGAWDGIYSPDGASIYYSYRGLWQVHVSPTTGESLGEPFHLAGGGATFIFHSTITADGKKIAYSVLAISSTLWSILLSPGTSEAQRSELFARDTSTRHNLARFSPDGRRIAFNRWRVGTSADIWVAEADGRNLTQLTSSPATDSQPSWFPEGDRIAFLSDRNNDHLILWSITLATGREEPLRDLGPGVEYAALSPDGKQIAFNSKKSGTINVWVAPVTGGEPKQLTFDKELMGFPSWSPDGKFLAFETKRGDDSHIFIIPSSGGTPIQLTNDHGQSFSHSWSPDGDKIAFAGLRDGIWNIYSVSRSTKEQKQLTHYSKLNAFARYPAWSPLGNQIVYEYAETIGNIWLIELK
jgi:Tol biopolymer transport system component